LQFAFDGSWDAVEAACDFLVGETFHFEKCDDAQLGIAKGIEKPAAFFGEDSRQFRCGSFVADLVDAAWGGGWIGVVEVRIAADRPAAAFGSALTTPLADGFALGQKSEDLPEVLGVVEPREASLLDASKETVEGAEGDVFFIACPA
jgi:hypothetical protein